MTKSRDSAPTSSRAATPARDPGTKRAPGDLEFEPITAEDEDAQSSPPDYQIATYPADFTLEVLRGKWEAGDIEIPDFQRGFVWTKPQASRLVESFLVGLPVPAIFLHNERRSEKYLVIDGQQRLRSLFYYFDGAFPGRRGSNRNHASDDGFPFRLTGLAPDSEFHNLAFSELSERDQRRLNNAVLRAFVVMQLDPDDDSSVYHIFERLNTGGTLLASQEIRNCIYRGRFVSLIEEINTFEPWRAIIGKDDPDSRGRDLELIVRFFATQEITDYRAPMKQFLNRYMNKNKNASEEAIAAGRNLFHQTCTAVHDELGPRPFHIRTGLNVAVMDAVMVAFSKNLDRIPDDLRSRFETLVAGDAFSRTTTQRTTDAAQVRERFKQAEERLFAS